MRRALNKVNLGESHISENLKSPNSDDKRLRFERRWKRQDARNDSLKNNHVASATRTTKNICGNTSVSINKNDHMIDDEIDDEIDEDWAKYLATYTGDDDDEADSDYEAYLATYNADIGADSATNLSGDNEVDPDYGTYPDIGADRASNQSRDSDEVDSDYGTYLATLNPDFEIDCDSSHNDGSNIDADFGNNSVSEEIEEDEDDQLLRKRRSSVRRTSLVSDQAFDTPDMQGDIEEDYAAFLNSVTIVDDDEEYFRVKNPTNTSNVQEDRSNSSNSDLIVMDSIPICENTPFISSKAYDLSVSVFNVMQRICILVIISEELIFIFFPNTFYALCV
jgi:hypothetical protein